MTATKADILVWIIVLMMIMLLFLTRCAAATAASPGWKAQRRWRRAGRILIHIASNTDTTLLIVHFEFKSNETKTNVLFLDFFVLSLNFQSQKSHYTFQNLNYSPFINCIKMSFLQ